MEAYVPLLFHFLKLSPGPKILPFIASLTRTGDTKKE